MDRKSSLLLIGSRTGRNVLKGKNVRKHDDGADNFADYWTDSGSDHNSDIISDTSQTQKKKSISEARLGTLRSQKSKVLHSATKIKNRQGYTKLQKSPLKHVKKNTLKGGKDIPTSLTKQKLPSKLQQGDCQNTTGVLSNISNSVNKSFVETESSSNFQSLVNNNGKSTLITTANIQISKNINEDEYIELNTSKPYALRRHEKKDGSPILSKSKKNVIKASVSPSRSRNLSHHISELATYDTNDVSKCTEDTVSPLSKESDKREVHNNVSNANVNASDFHILSSMKVISAEANSSNAESEIHPLADKSLISNTVGNGEVSKILKTSFGYRTVKKMKNSLQVTRIMAKYDEYDAEMMRMAKDNDKSLKVHEKEHYSYSLYNFKPTRGKEAKSIALKCTANSDEETNEIAPKETDASITEDQNSYNSSNKLCTWRKQKNSVINDRIDTELLQNKSGCDARSNTIHIEVEAANVSDIDDGTQVSLISEKHSSEDKVASSLNNSKRSYIDKSMKELRTSKYLSMDNSRNGSKFPEDAVVFDNKRKKHVKTIKNLKASETFSAKNTESTTDVAAKEDNIAQNISIKRKKYVSKIPKNLKASKTFTKGDNDSATEKKIAQNLGNKREECMNKTNEILKASESFSNGSDESAIDISTKENDIPQNLNIEKKTRLSKIRENLKASSTFSKGNTDNSAKEKEIAQNLVDEGEECINKTCENMKASETFSKSVGNIVEIPEVENRITQIRHDKNKTRENKTKKKRTDSETFSKSVGNIVEIPEIENRITPIRHDKNKRHENKTKKNRKGSEIFSKPYQWANEVPVAENETISTDNKRKKSVSEDSLLSTDNYDKIILSPKKKRRKEKNEIRTKESAVHLRRSHRQKFPRLANWRNERILYENKSGIVCATGIHKGTREDDGAIRHFMNRNKKDNVQKIKNRRKINIYDVVSKKRVKLPLVQNFNNVPWDKGFQNEECPYRIKKIFETENSSSGYIQIDINKEKPIQYMPNDDIYIFLVRGKVEVVINDVVSVVEEKGMFVIPRNVPYSIKNIGSVKALLAFCVGIFHYMENGTWEK